MNTLEDRLRAALAAKSDAVTLDEHESGIEMVPDDVVRLAPGASSRSQRSRGLVASVVAVAAMLLLAVGAVALHRTTTAHRFDPGQVRPRSAIPWNQVGPGWALVQETPRTVPAGDHQESAGDEQLQLVDPSGVRYRITSLGTRAWMLVAWDRAHRRALLQSPFHEPPGQVHGTTDLAVVDLRSGSRHSFTVEDAPTAARLGGPGGQYVVLSNGYYVATYTLTGQAQRRIGPLGSTGRTADSPDGRQVIAGGAAGLQVYDYASGRLAARLPAPKGYGGCYDARWSGDGTLLANCLRDGKVGTTPGIFVFSVDGVPAAGRPDPQYPTVTDGRVTGFRQGTVRTSYPVDDPQQPGAGSWPLLTRMTATRLDSTGHTSPIQVPAQLRAGQWMIANATPETFTVVNLVGPNSGLLTAAVSWNPFTGQLTDPVRPSAPGAALIEVRPWDAQQYY